MMESFRIHPFELFRTSQPWT